MVLYAADPDTLLSPTVVIALGSVSYLSCVLDLMFEFCANRERRIAANEFGPRDPAVGIGSYQRFLIVQINDFRLRKFDNMSCRYEEAPF
jgi:hypothetical protein